MVDLLSLRSERLPARCENVNLRGLAEYILSQRGDDLDDVLAAIEQQQHSLLAEEGQYGWEGIVRSHRDAEF
jgi:hypothetical protein